MSFPPLFEPRVMAAGPNSMAAVLSHHGRGAIVGMPEVSAARNIEVLDGIEAVLPCLGKPMSILLSTALILIVALVTRRNASRGETVYRLRIGCLDMLTAACNQYVTVMLLC